MCPPESVPPLPRSGGGVCACTHIRFGVLVAMHQRRVWSARRRGCPCGARVRVRVPAVCVCMSVRPRECVRGHGHLVQQHRPRRGQQPACWSLGTALPTLSPWGLQRAASGWKVPHCPSVSPVRPEDARRCSDPVRSLPATGLSPGKPRWVRGSHWGTRELRGFYPGALGLQRSR